MTKTPLELKNEQNILRISSIPQDLKNYQNTLGLIKMKKKISLKSLNDKNTPQTIVLLLLFSGLNCEDV